MTDSNQWLDSLPAPNGILESVQRRGREALTQTKAPNNSFENWRLTDIRKLENLLTLPVYKKENSIENDFPLKVVRPPSDGIRLILNHNSDPLERVNLPKGLSSLTKLELEQNLGRTNAKCLFQEEWPVALNYASASNLLALKVTGKAPPIELILSSNPNQFNPTRVIFVLEENAELDLLEIAMGSEESAHSHLIEIHLSQESKVQHGMIAIGKKDSHLLCNIAIQQDIRSEYSLTCVQTGWSLARLEPHVVQVNGNAKTNIKGLQLSKKDQQLTTNTQIRFDGPDGMIEQLQKSAATDKSQCIFNGVIEVPRIAQRSNASQLSRNLLLSKKARIDTKPELRIIADDVRCAHGATVSQLKEDELFYLRSRGISSAKAADLLLKGFYQEILSLLPVEADRWDVLNTLLDS